MKPIRLQIAQSVCRYLPPFISPRVRHWIYPRVLGITDNYTYTVTAQTGSWFTSTTGDFHGYSFALHGYNYWRAWAIALAITKPGDTIIEVGANIGTETVGFGDIVGREGHVYAFEPLPSNLDVLEKNLALHQYSNITVMPFALSDTNGPVNFQVPTVPHMSGTGHISHGSSINNNQTIVVECRTLDSLQQNLGTASLLFMDAEGAEYSILKGGYNYLTNNGPTLVVEAGGKQLSHHGLRPQDLYDEIRTLGYEIFSLTRFGLEVVQKETIKHSTSDWLCVKPERIDLIPRVKKLLILCGLLPSISFLNPMSRKRL